MENELRKEVKRNGKKKIAILYDDIDECERMIIKISDQICKDYELVFMGRDNKLEIYFQEIINLEGIIKKNIFASCFHKICRKIRLMKKIFYSRKPEYLVFGKRCIKKIKKLFEARNFDIVIANSYFYTILITTCLDDFKNRPKLVSWQHVPNINIPVFSKKFDFMDPLIGNMCKVDKYVVSTYKMQLQIDELLGIEATIIPESLDLNKEFVERELSSFAVVGQLNFLCDSPLDPIRAFKIVNLQSVKLCFFFPDDPQGLNLLNEEINGFPNIYCYPSKLILKPEYVYSNTGCLLLTSKYEGMPMTVLEAFSYSIPVITYDAENIAGIVIDDYNGVIVKDDNVKALADAMIKLINDPVRYKRLASNAYKSHFQYQTIEVKKQWVKLIEELLN